MHQRELSEVSALILPDVLSYTDYLRHRVTHRTSACAIALLTGHRQHVVALHAYSRVVYRNILKVMVRINKGFKYAGKREERGLALLFFLPFFLFRKVSRLSA